MMNSGMVCRCGGEVCDHWHPVENFVHDHGFLPFPPHLKYEMMIDRQEAGLFGNPGRKFSFYKLNGELGAVPEHLVARAAALSVPWDPCGKDPRPWC
jgi:hypothetical protein